MKFCRKCGYIFDITDDVKRRQVGGKINKAVTSILEKFKDNQSIELDDIQKINPGDLLHNTTFETMTKKDQGKLKSIIKALDKQFFSDADNSDAVKGKPAYFICKHCKNSKLIPSGTIIYTKDYGSVSTEIDMDDYSNLIHDHSLARTRAYVCHNPKCKTHENEELREAIITKDKTYRPIYVCTVCSTHWTVSM